MKRVIPNEHNEEESRLIIHKSFKKTKKQ